MPVVVTKRIAYIPLPPGPPEVPSGLIIEEFVVKDRRDPHQVSRFRNLEDAIGEWLGRMRDRLICYASNPNSEEYVGVSWEWSQHAGEWVRL